MVIGGHKEGKNEGKPETVRMPEMAKRKHIFFGRYSLFYVAYMRILLKFPHSFSQNPKIGFFASL